VTSFPNVSFPSQDAYTALPEPEIVFLIIPGTPGAPSFTLIAQLVVPPDAEERSPVNIAFCPAERLIVDTSLLKLLIYRHVVMPVKPAGQQPSVFIADDLPSTGIPV
jgi:hypothetical protein